jgi:hypothetical protein
MDTEHLQCYRDTRTQPNTTRILEFLQGSVATWATQQHWDFQRARKICQLGMHFRVHSNACGEHHTACRSALYNERRLRQRQVGT